MWSKLFGINAKRTSLLANTREGSLHDFYATDFPELNSAVDDISFAVLDFETTGLDIKQDHIVSVGLVEINKLGINLNTAWHAVIKTERDLPEESTVIHQITDDMVSQGIEIKKALDMMLARLKGRVLVAHHAQIELGYLSKICRDIYQQDFVIPVIDTQQLAKRQLQRDQTTLKANSLRLFNLCDRYRLPSYKAHNALSDALSTAELFLVVVAELYPNMDCRLKDLVLKK